MQKIVLCTLAVLAAALAAPAPAPAPAPRPQEQHADSNQVYILKHEANVSPDGYHFEFETSDGTSRQEQGTLKQISEDMKAIEVQGSYRYSAPDGLIYSVTYTADENGFRPQEHVEHSGQGQEQYQQ